MAQKITVVLEDDLTGLPGDDVETVEFGLDGVAYQIDLNTDNADRLRRDVLAEFVAHARRTGGRVKRGLGGRGAQTTNSATAPASRNIGTAGYHRGPEQTKAVREWARNEGYSVSSRGRIPAEIMEAFDAAHAPAPARRGRGR